MCRLQGQGFRRLHNCQHLCLLEAHSSACASCRDKEAGHVLAIDKRVPSKSGKAVFTTSGSLIDMDVVP